MLRRLPVTLNARGLEGGPDRKWMNGIFDEESFRMAGAEELLPENIGFIVQLRFQFLCIFHKPTFDSLNRSFD